MNAQTLRHVLAIDVGSSSGKAILGSWQDGAISYREIKRFTHTPKWQANDSSGDEGGQAATLRWDLDGITAAVRACLDEARDYLSQTYPGQSLDACAVDTWGVDYVWLDEAGRPLAAPYSYRDARGETGRSLLLERLDEAQLWQLTGNQAESIATCMQLTAELNATPQLLQRGHQLAFLPDYLATSLGAELSCGQGIASTSALADPTTTQWCRPVLEAVELPEEKLPPLQPEGKVVGTNRETAIIKAGSHDTACAVSSLAAIGRVGDSGEPKPGDPGTAFIATGSWCLVGMVTAHPVLSEQARMAGLSNETGADGRNHLLANLTGLWLVQQARQAWRRQGQDFSYAQLSQQASAAPSLGVVVDTQCPRLFQGGDIPAIVAAECERIGGVRPQSPGQCVRVIIESIAAAQARALEQIAAVTGTKPKRVYMVGGGIRDHLLCQLTAQACELPVTLGEVEATAVGSILNQLRVLGVDTDGIGGVQFA